MRANGRVVCNVVHQKQLTKFYINYVLVLFHVEQLSSGYQLARLNSYAVDSDELLYMPVDNFVSNLRL